MNATYSTVRWMMIIGMLVIISLIVMIENNPQKVKAEGTISLLGNISQVSTRGLHSCALTTSGSIKCWGYNAYGQLGDGSTQNSNVPVDVYNLDNAVYVSAGDNATCALTNTGGVKCWGYNGDGSLGNGNNISSRIAVDVSGLSSGVKAIGTGVGFACALTSVGGVKCWVSRAK